MSAEHTQIERTTALPWLAAAWAELGELEVSGRAANPKIIGYFKAVGHPEIVSDEVAWCAAFAGRCLIVGGILLAIAPAERLLANSYMKCGVPIDDLRVGAVCVLSRGSDKSKGHVGFVVGWTDEHVVLLGGNQANSVSVAHFPRARIRAIVWPQVVTPTQLDAAGSRITTGAKRSGSDAVKATVAPNVPAPPAFDLPPPDAIAGKASALQASVEQVMQFSTFVHGRWPWVVGAVAAYYGLRALWTSSLIRKWRAQDASSGKTATDLAPPGAAHDVAFVEAAT